MSNIRLDKIDLSLSPSAEHVLAAMKNNVAEGISVQQIIELVSAAIIGGAPDALDTLNELAAAINDDASFSATVLLQIAAIPSVINDPTMALESETRPPSQSSVVDYIQGLLSGGQGKVRQVLTSSLTTAASTTSTSLASSGVSQSITVDGTNKVLVCVSGLFGMDTYAAQPKFALYRDAVELEIIEPYWYAQSGRPPAFTMPLVFSIEDIPTAGTYAYELKMQTNSASYPIYLNRSADSATVKGLTTMTVWEVAS